jgi:transposase
MRRTRTPTELGLTGHDRNRLAEALRRTRELLTYRRAQAVLGVARGSPIREVASLAATSCRTVYGWVQRYLRRHRVEDLRDAPRPGRPAAAPVLTDARIVREFEKDPLRLGYRSTGWTVDLLARHLSRRYDCAISGRTLRRRMRNLGLSWKRTRHVYKSPAEHLGQKKGASSAA